MEIEIAARSTLFHNNRFDSAFWHSLLPYGPTHLTSGKIGILALYQCLRGLNLRFSNLGKRAVQSVFPDDE